MPRIDGVPQSDPSQRPDRVEARRAESRRAEGAGRTRSGERPQASDSVELSADAQRAQALQDRLSQEVRDVPDVREDRVAQARARMQAGEYDTENVRRVIADRLLEQMGL